MLRAKRLPDLIAIKPPLLQKSSLPGPVTIIRGTTRTKFFVPNAARQGVPVYVTAFKMHHDQFAGNAPSLKLHADFQRALPLADP